jgi:hypothetical protein
MSCLAASALVAQRLQRRRKKKRPATPWRVSPQENPRVVSFDRDFDKLGVSHFLFIGG